MCRPVIPADTQLVSCTLDLKIMSEKMKIVVLGTADYLTKNLITLIIEKDVFENSLTQIEKYDSGMYEVTYIPILDAQMDDIKPIPFAPTDMCLLMLNSEISADVEQKINNVLDKTGISKEKLIGVLPLRQRSSEHYPCKCYTMRELFSKLARDKNQITTKKRPADPPLTEMETDNSPSFMSTVFRSLIPGSRSSFKGNHSDNKVNLVLLGMSGTGKSACGNTILGKKQFVSRASYMPVTTECQEAETVINGTCYRVIDTPDIFDDATESSVKNQHVAKCKQLIQPGPCVFLLVLHISRFTDGERDILKKLEKAFGSRAKEQTVILFTRGEELQRADMSFEDFLQDCQPDLKNIVDQCGGRCVVFENKATHQHQVTELMQTVIGMLK